MSNITNSELSKFKQRFYDKMLEVCDNTLRRACCGIVAEEARLFVSSYAEQDREFMDVANGIVVKFLNDFEQQSYSALNVVDTILVDIGDEASASK